MAQAQADAAKVEALALGDKNAAILRAEGEAQALDILGTALAKNRVVKDLRAIEKWDCKLPTSMVPGSALPFVNVK